VALASTATIAAIDCRLFFTRWSALHQHRDLLVCDRVLAFKLTRSVSSIASRICCFVVGSVDRARIEYHGATAD
jgi:hypothetical protein